jgi:CRP-like cAMP-binding protein
MAKKAVIRVSGPAIRATHPWLSDTRSTQGPNQLLDDDKRSQLATIATIVRFKKGEQICARGKPADTIYNIAQGTVKSYAVGPDGGEYISAFLYPQDVFGVSEEGRYTNSVKAITRVVAYALPVSLLRRQLLADAELAIHLVVRLWDELRQAQHHAVLLAQRHAFTRLAMFLMLQKNLQTATEYKAEQIYLPMSRTEIGEYVGLSLGAVSRGFRELAERGIISNTTRRHVKILDPNALRHFASHITSHGGGG